ncbi:unnamed protein product [Rotaria sp. Silwood1]|nr:unnamed protein product [Rotaria sp. Silwood1]
MRHSTLTENFFKQTYETPGAYLRANDDLSNLPSDDRSGLLRSAAESVQCLSTVFVCHQSQLYIHQPFLNACRHLYGEQSVAMVHHVMKYIDPDVVLVKLALA